MINIYYKFAIDSEETTENGLVVQPESNSAQDEPPPSYQAAGYHGYQFSVPQTQVSGQSYQFYETPSNVEEPAVETAMLHQFQTSQV